MSCENGSGDTETLLKVKKPKDVIAWRGFVTAALAFIGYGQFTTPGASAQLERINSSLGELKQSVAILTATTTSQGDRQDTSLRDHETRLRDLERKRPL